MGMDAGSGIGSESLVKTAEGDFFSMMSQGNSPITEAVGFNHADDGAVGGEDDLVGALKESLELLHSDATDETEHFVQKVFNNPTFRQPTMDDRYLENDR